MRLAGVAYLPRRCSLLVCQAAIISFCLLQLVIYDISFISVDFAGKAFPTGAYPRRLLKNASKVQRSFENTCRPLMKGHSDIIKPEDGAPCWNSCQQELATSLLNSFLGRWQGWVQAKLEPMISRIPLYISNSILIFVFYFTAILCLAGTVGALVDGTEWGEYLMILLSVFVAMLHAWNSMIAGLCLLAASVASDTATIIHVGDAVSWSAPWLKVIRHFNLPYAPTVVSIIVEIVAICFIVVSVGKKAFVLDIGPASPFCSKALFLAFIAFGALVAEACFLWIMQFVVIFSLGFFSAGEHGMVWVCAKSAAATSFGHLPKQCSYVGGLCYVLASVLHGLLLDYPHPEPHTFTPPSPLIGVCFSDAAVSRLFLFITFGGLMADILTDFAQTMLFFRLSQIFFGLFNVTGLAIQVMLLFYGMVRGFTPEVPFLSIILQSDAIVHFRSSWIAGFPLYELLEKTYREAFGETYVSLSVGIVALFKVPLEDALDILLFVSSIMLSLKSVKSGVAEAYEFQSAESEVTVCKPDGMLTEFRASLIPRNHYYYRRELSRRRKLGWITAVRVSETLVPMVTGAVFCCCTTVKNFYLVSVAIATLLQGVPLLRNHHPEILHFFKTTCLDVINAKDKREAFFEFFVCIFIILASFITVAVFVIVSPMPYFLLYPSPITMYQREKGDMTEELLDFTQLLGTKSVFVGALWALMVLSMFTPEGLLPIEVDKFIQELKGPLSAWPPDAAFALALVKSGLVVATLIGILVLLLAVFTLKADIEAWKKTDAKTALELRGDCSLIQKTVNTITRQLRALGILDKRTYVGDRLSSDSDYFVRALCIKLVDYTYGPADRPGRPAKGRPQYDPIEDNLRMFLGSGTPTPFYSPSALAEDLRQIASKIRDRRLTPHLTSVRDSIDRCATWLEYLGLLSLDDIRIDKVVAPSLDYEELSDEDASERAENMSRLDWHRCISFHHYHWGDVSARQAQIHVWEMEEAASEAVATEAKKVVDSCAGLFSIHAAQFGNTNGKGNLTAVGIALHMLMAYPKKLTSDEAKSIFSCLQSKFSEELASIEFGGIRLQREYRRPENGDHVFYIANMAEAMVEPVRIEQAENHEGLYTLRTSEGNAIHPVGSRMFFLEEDKEEEVLLCSITNSNGEFAPLAIDTPVSFTSQSMLHMKIFVDWFSQKFETC